MTHIAVNDEMSFDLDLRDDSLIYFSDYLVDGAPVIPAMVYVEMALVMAEDALEQHVIALHNVRFRQMFRLSDSMPQMLQVVVQPTATDTASFWVYDAADPQKSRMQHVYVTGTASTKSTKGVQENPQLDDLKKRCTTPVTPAAHYAAMQQHGITYGKCVQPIVAAWQGQNEALVQLKLPASMVSGADVYSLHPVLLDGACQAVALAQTDSGYTPRLLPLELESLSRDAQIRTSGWAHVIITSNTAAVVGQYVAHITLFNETGRVAARIYNLVMHCTEPFLRTKPPSSAFDGIALSIPDVLLQSVDQQLASIWAEVLQLPSVATDDDFFEIGGDSLMASQIATKAQRIGISITPQQLLEHRTIACLLMTV